MITDKSKLLFESGADVSQQYCQQSRWQSTRLQQILLLFIFFNGMLQLSFLRHTIQQKEREQRNF